MTKRILSVILTIAMLLSVLVCTTVFTGAANTEKLGDVDGDGDIAIVDATAIQRHLADLTKLDKAAIARAMVCGNDDLSILDATCIQRYLADIPYTIG